jgi:quercetin dioxygenase-like cupin family protein
MKAIHRSSAEILSTPRGIEGRKLHETGHVQVIHLTLQPGEALPRHSAPVDAFFYVLEGSGIVETDDESMEAGEGTLIASAGGSMHLWRNTSAVPLRVLVVKTPSPQRPKA